MEHVDSKTFFKIRKLCVNRKHLNNPNVYTKVQIVFNLWFLNKRKKKQIYKVAQKDLQLSGMPSIKEHSEGREVQFPPNLMIGRLSRYLSLCK